jgi:glycosyltransferase involved in cell wall biosynthesis
MIITLLLQTYNELESGHLERFLNWNRELCDHLVVLDDQSTDGTQEYLRKHCDLVLETKCRSFNSELYNKQSLLDHAKSEFPDTDWFLWLDADELLLLSKEELETHLRSAQDLGFDSISLPLINLWKSEFFYRVDSSFDNLVNTRLWKNSNSLFYKPRPGLHLPLHPHGLHNTLAEENIKVLHFGFSSFDLIVDKFANYRKLGQRGEGLWRLIDESKLDVRQIDSRLHQLGSRANKFYSQISYSPVVVKNDFYDYIWASRLVNQKGSPVKTRITLLSLIYSGVDWLEFQYGELLKLASELPPGEVEILFVANDANESVISFLESNGIPFIVSPGRKDAKEWYINSVYRSYNYGVSQAKGEYVLLTNSDMAYSDGFLYGMILEAVPEIYLVSKLIESGRLRPAKVAIKINLGKTLKRFRRAKFLKISSRLRKRGLEDGGLFMPALLHKETFLKYGGYPEGNLKVDSLKNYLQGLPYEFAKLGEDLIPGDSAFMSLLNQYSIEHKTNLNSIAYHFQEGEKSEFNKRAVLNSPSGFAIANDRLIGINLERTLWNYLIDDLTSLKFKVQAIALGTGRKVPYRFISRSLYAKPKARVLFRNATFLRQIRGSWRQIVLVQDSVSNKKILRNQNLARSKSAAEITNSQVFIGSPQGRLSLHQYLMPLPIESAWDNFSGEKNIIRGSRIRAIFIGAFNETKGWELVRPLVEKYQSIDFLLVSKYADDRSGLDSDIGENWEIKRNLSTHDLIREVDNSNFLILGSPFETQCLVAIECALRNIPVLMQPTGLLATLPAHDREKIGIFATDLDAGLIQMAERLKKELSDFKPREILKKYGLDNESLRKEWLEILVSELQLSFIPKTPVPLINQIKRRTPKRLKQALRKLLRTLFTKPKRK